jgi:Bifunctional DNA primase/polymerase, N-terminal/Primase C terminal 1 (PriCT-1)
MRALLQRYADAYNAQGWGTVKLRPNDKRPFERGWQTRPYRDPAAFTNHRGNLGVQLGGASGGLVDVDLDCLEAIKLAPQFLPSTPAQFGRASKPRSHWLYKATGPTPAKKFYCDKKVIVELRGDHESGWGGQTAFPPSTHPSGEAYAWEADADTPTVIAYAALRTHVEQLAAAVCAARGWTPRAAEQVLGSTSGAARFSEHGGGFRYPAVIATRHNVGACLLGGLEFGTHERPIGIEEGARDDTLMRHAGSCFARGIDFDDTLAECLACNETFSPPMSESQVHKIVKSIAHRDSAQRAQRCADYEFIRTWCRG